MQEPTDSQKRILIMATKASLYFLFLPFVVIFKVSKWFGVRAKKTMSRPSCPYCGSMNNNIENPFKAYMDNSTRASKKLGAGLIFTPAAFLVGNKRKQDGVPTGECFDCGRKWRLGAKNLGPQQP